MWNFSTYVCFFFFPLLWQIWYLFSLNKLELIFRCVYGHLSCSFGSLHFLFSTIVSLLGTNRLLTFIRVFFILLHHWYSSLSNDHSVYLFRWIEQDRIINSAPFSLNFVILWILVWLLDKIESLSLLLFEILAFVFIYFNCLAYNKALFLNFIYSNYCYYIN